MGQRDCDANYLHICYYSLMNLQEFVKDVLVQINAAVDEARQITSRDIRFSDNDGARTIEFDIAVSADEKNSQSGNAGIKVLRFVEAGGDMAKELKNSTVSRIVFGLHIELSTKIEREAQNNSVITHNNENASNWTGQY